ncbi:MAG TPA: SDR family NAD(P)-dependent oxidoreductase [Acidimicrobiales bacterium]|jgi:NADP-dependent 3-hydroxy acid dehydrogenase YdfG|nr:SDR family NAD(P)-dependent oxidoreductase [Acidimicrobiales bacterium]
MSSGGTAVITGASSGIGAATARALAAAGFSVVLGARRVERLAALAAEIGPAATANHLDVTDPASVDSFTWAIPECRVLINCAGGALGMEPIAEANEAHWQAMYDTNVLGTLRMTRALLPRLVASGDGMVITIGSVAAFEPYAGGAGYNAAKHATRALMDVLRLELVGQPIRVSEIDPGLVETEFSLVRFGGDADRADDVYRGLTPLRADDISEVVAFVATRPSHVDIDTVVIRPRDQARVWLVHREPSADPAVRT